MRAWLRYGLGVVSVSIGLFLLSVLTLIQRPVLPTQLSLHSSTASPTTKYPVGSCASVLGALTREWELTLVALDDALTKDDEFPELVSLGVLAAQSLALAKVRPAVGSCASVLGALTREWELTLVALDDALTKDDEFPELVSLGVLAAQSLALAKVRPAVGSCASVLGALTREWELTLVALDDALTKDDEFPELVSLGVLAAQSLALAKVRPAVGSCASVLGALTREWELTLVALDDALTKDDEFPELVSLGVLAAQSLALAKVRPAVGSCASVLGALTREWELTLVALDDALTKDDEFPELVSLGVLAAQSLALAKVRPAVGSCASVLGALTREWELTLVALDDALTKDDEFPELVSLGVLAAQSLALAKVRPAVGSCASVLGALTREWELTLVALDDALTKDDEFPELVSLGVLAAQSLALAKVRPAVGSCASVLGALTREWELTLVALDDALTKDDEFPELVSLGVLAAQSLALAKVRPAVGSCASVLGALTREWELTLVALDDALTKDDEFPELVSLGVLAAQSLALAKVRPAVGSCASVLGALTREWELILVALDDALTKDDEFPELVSLGVLAAQSLALAKVRSAVGSCASVLGALTREWELTLVALDDALTKDDEFPELVSLGVLAAQSLALAKVRPAVGSCASVLGALTREWELTLVALDDALTKDDEFPELVSLGVLAAQSLALAKVRPAVGSCASVLGALTREWELTLVALDDALTKDDEFPELVSLGVLAAQSLALAKVRPAVGSCASVLGALTREWELTLVALDDALTKDDEFPELVSLGVLAAQSLALAKVRPAVGSCASVLGALTREWELTLVALDDALTKDDEFPELVSLGVLAAQSLALAKVRPAVGSCASVLGALTREWELTLVALDDALTKDDEFPELVSLGVLAAQSLALAKALRSDLGVPVLAAHCIDPRYFDRDPEKHRDNIPLRNAHVLLTPPDCTIHIALIVPRGADENGKATYNWIAPVNFEDYSRKIVINHSARAFTMQELLPLSHESALGRLVESERLAGPKDPSLLHWQAALPYLECPHHNAHHFMRNHFNETNEKLTRPMKTRLRQGLLAQMARLDALRLPAFLIAGSVLGWARECDVLSYADIPRNTDVDFAVYARDTKGPQVVKDLAKSAKNNPYMRRALGNYGIQSYEIRWSWKFDPPMTPLYSAIAFDLFFLFPNKDGPMGHYSIFYTGDKRWWGNIHVPIIRPDQICSTDLNGVLVRVPCDPLPFLEAGYGRGWDEPLQKWSYGGGRKVNFHYAGNWTEAQDGEMQQSKF